jgi:hypothetical protein
VTLAPWRIRAAALLAMAVILGAGLAVHFLGWDNAGTALYASMVYAGVFVLAPRTRPWVAGPAAIVFCWAVEISQLTGLPAELSQRSAIARLALGVQFDAEDLFWYVVGAVPLAVLHHVVTVKRIRAPRAQVAPEPARAGRR